MGLRAAKARAEQARRGDLGGPVQGRQVPQEPADHRQPPGRVMGIGGGGRCCPGQAGLQPDRAAMSGRIQGVGEPAQQPLRRARSIAQTPTQRDVLLDLSADLADLRLVVGWAVHDVTRVSRVVCSQGRATSRRAARSTEA